MTEREQPFYWSNPAMERETPPYGDRDQPTVPGFLPAADAGPAILGFPAEVVEDDDVPPADSLTSSPRRVTRRPVARRRRDVLAGLLLLLAGLAGGASLVLHWVPGERALGLAAVQRGVRALGAGIGELGSSGLWQPLAVVLGGGVLFLLGMLLFVPARTHRALGVLALLVAAAAAVGVLVPLSAAGWHPDRFDIGMWCAVAVAALGLLGALKAMLTGPRFPTSPRLR